MPRPFLALVGAFCIAATLRAAVVDYALVIARGDVDFTGKTVPALTINGGIPGPVLRFTEGDTARITVKNDLSVPTSLHWHGMLVPNDMDGVPYVTFPPIAPGASFTYQFPVRQAGTYWYHSHSALQEQQGLYGAIVIAPRGGDPRYPGLPEHVVLLSDWTDQAPERVMHTLHSGNDFYSVRRHSAQSLLGAIRAGRLVDYLSRELLRMPAMDISDVAYDRFLVNGRPGETWAARPGARVRLRLVNGSSGTFFHVEFAGGPMTIVAADGQDVEPVEVRRLLMGIAETYDVLVTVPRDGRFELRATSQDRSGRASLWLGAGGEKHYAPLVPAPDLYATMDKLSWGKVFALTPNGTMGMTNARVAAGDFDRPGMNGMDMGGMDMNGMKMSAKPGDHAMSGMNMDHDMDGMDMEGMDMGDESLAPAAQAAPDSADAAAVAGQPMPAMAAPPGLFSWMADDLSSQGPLVADGSPGRPWSPYAELRATHPTAFAASMPVRVIRLTLDGDMERYAWFINGKPLAPDDDIRIRRGEVVRFIMINRTMMHHPMHLHGHFFRVLNGQGAYSPLKHTVDVEPMGTTVIEFAADERGDWVFHCHVLYHMESGMMRVVSYEGFRPDAATAAVRHMFYMDPYYFFGGGTFASNMTEGTVELADIHNILRADWRVGWAGVPVTEWEGIGTYGRYLNRFTTVFAGADFLGEGRRPEHVRGVAGIAYTLPFELESRAWADTDGGARVSLGRMFALTPRLGLDTEAEYDTHTRWDGSAGLRYTLTQNLGLRVLWDSDYKWGAGIDARF